MVVRACGSVTGEVQGETEIQMSAPAGRYRAHVTMRDSSGLCFLASSAPFEVLEAPPPSAIKLNVEWCNEAHTFAPMQNIAVNWEVDSDK